MTEITGERKDHIVNVLENTAMYGEPGSYCSSLVDVGNSEYLEYFQKEIIDGLLASGGSTCRFFEGPYGSGKTHLLGLLQETAIRSGMVVVRTDLSSDLRLENWWAVTSYILQNMTAIINGEEIRSLPNILEARGRSEIKGFINLKNASLPHPGFKNAILQALQLDNRGDDARCYLRSYLQGEKVTVAELQKAGVEGVKNPLNQRNAEIILKTVIEGLNIIGIPGVMLLFDENERTLQPNRKKPTKKQILSANLIRHLVDGCVTGSIPRTVVIFTILPGFLETVTVHYQALGQRLSMIRDMQYSGSWRWPVLTLEQINTAGSPENFLKNAINRMCVLVEQCGGSVTGLAPKMEISGQKILEENAGPGYKRDLMKSLSTLAAKRVGEGI